MFAQVVTRSSVTTTMYYGIILRETTTLEAWRTTHGGMGDEEWVLIADLVEPYPSRGKMGRPVKNDRRAVVNAICSLAATGY